MSDTQHDDFYLLLGVPPSASEDEIYAAYRDRCFLLHPDRLAGVPVGARQRAEQDIRRLNLAWETLGDPVSRTAHDAWYHARHIASSGPEHVAPRDRTPDPLVTTARGRALPPSALRFAAVVVALVVAVGGWALGRSGREAPPSTHAAAAAPSSVLVPDATPPPPLVGDGGFEDAASPWVLEHGFERVAGAGRSGSVALRVPGEGGWSNAHTRFSLPTAGCYHLALWVRGEGEGRVDILTADWQPVATVRAGRAALWTRLDLSFSTAHTNDLVLAVRDSDAGPGLLVDDIILSPCAHD